MSERRDPVGLAEWQLAVNAAQACLLLESARAFGLVTGGPRVDARRCFDLLDRARGRFISPQDAGVDSEITALVASSFHSRIR